MYTKCLELVYSKDYFNLTKIFPFEAIQNGCKSNRLLQAWTIFGGWDMWNMEEHVLVKKFSQID